MTEYLTRRPLDSGRHPFELFTLYLGMVAGIPLLFGAPKPHSTTALLGPGLATVWGWILTVGCFIALTGVWWTWWRWVPRWDPTITTGLLIERIGLISMGVGCLIYTWGVVAAGDPPGRLVAAALVGGLAAAAFWRAVQIQLWINDEIRSQRQEP